MDVMTVGDDESRLAAAWRDFVAATAQVVAALAAPGTDIPALGPATGELHRAAGGLDHTVRDMQQRGRRTVPGNPVDALLSTVLGRPEDLAPPDSPRSEWSDAEVLLAAAYRLADLADALLTAPDGPAITAAELNTALAAARRVLDAAG